jgi:hypothetical protein
MEEDKLQDVYNTVNNHLSKSVIHLLLDYLSRGKGAWTAIFIRCSPLRLMIAMFYIVIVIVAAVTLPHSLAPPLSCIFTTSCNDTDIVIIVSTVASVNIAVP